MSMYTRITHTHTWRLLAKTQYNPHIGTQTLIIFQARIHARPLTHAIIYLNVLGRRQQALFKPLHLYFQVLQLRMVGGQWPFRQIEMQAAKNASICPVVRGAVARREAAKMSCCCRAGLPRRSSLSRGRLECLSFALSRPLSISLFFLSLSLSPSSSFWAHCIGSRRANAWHSQAPTLDGGKGWSC